MSVAIVTGASRGLGQALAEGLAREGWSLVIDGRDATALGDAAARLEPLLAPGGAGAGAAGSDPAHSDPAHSSTPGLVVRDNPESQTYDALMGDEIAGTLLYEREGPRLVLTHTAVQHKYQHQGIATTLIANALDDIRAKGKKVTILCPLVAAFIAGHPDYADLVDAEHPGITN